MQGKFNHKTNVVRIQWVTGGAVQLCRVQSALLGSSRLKMVSGYSRYRNSLHCLEPSLLPYWPEFLQQSMSKCYKGYMININNKRSLLSLKRFIPASFDLNVYASSFWEGRKIQVLCFPLLYKSWVVRQIYCMSRK